jgi:hypothetical protein
MTDQLSEGEEHRWLAQADSSGSSPFGTFGAEGYHVLIGNRRMKLSRKLPGDKAPGDTGPTRVRRQRSVELLCNFVKFP